MKQIYYIVSGSDYMPDDEELERAPLIDEPDDPPESRPGPSQQKQGHKMASSKIKRSEHPLWRQKSLVVF